MGVEQCPAGEFERPATILIVDDGKINRELLKLNLMRHGHEFLMACNGREALEVLEANPQVDLIMLDLMMPEMDGFDFLAWRQNHVWAQAVPVIVNSALDDFDSIARALTMDAYDYFTKPLSQRDLETVLPIKIKNAVTTHRLLIESQRQNEIMTRELEMAGRYQRFMLPAKASVDWGQVEFLFQPCTGVGGDYFDLIDLPGGKSAIALADVSGHGVASAMIASIVKALLPGYLASLGSPGQALAALNQDLLQLTQEDVFVTGVAVIYDPSTRCLTWSAAGHPPALYLPKQGPCQRLEMASFFLGIFDSSHDLSSYPDQELHVQPGDRLALYTDGLTEAPSPQRDQFGLDRVQDLLMAGADMELAQLRDSVWDGLSAFVQGDCPDDVALVLLET